MFMSVSCSNRTLQMPPKERCKAEDRAGLFLICTALHGYRFHLHYCVHVLIYIIVDEAQASMAAGDAWWWLRGYDEAAWAQNEMGERFMGSSPPYQRVRWGIDIARGETEWIDCGPWSSSFATQRNLGVWAVKQRGVVAAVVFLLPSKEERRDAGG